MENTGSLLAQHRWGRLHRHHPCGGGGRSFASRGYNGTISSAFLSPIAGRMAWSGNAGTYVNTVANLGPNVNGQTIKLRFRMASDCSVGVTGWRVDTISVVVGTCPSPTPSPTASPSPGACVWTAGPVVRLRSWIHRL